MSREDRYDEIARRTRAGQTIAQIASAMNISTNTVSRGRHLRAVNHPAPLPLTIDEIRIALALLEEGSGYHAAASAIGRSRAALVRRFPGFALTRTEITERQALGRALAKLR